MTRWHKVLIRGIGNISKLSRKEFIDLKQSDTLVVFGCGYSINYLTKEEIENLSKYDAISFNWFCFSYIRTTFYLVREQANLDKRTCGAENVTSFIDIMSDKIYKDTCLIIHDISDHSPDAFNYTLKRHIRKFPNPYVVVKDKKLRFNSCGCKIFSKTDIFKEGVIHGRCTLNNVLHISTFLNYKRIIFVGVDLYDSRYFWLKKKETRYAVQKKKRTFKSKHAISRSTILLLQEFQRTNKVEMFVYNPKSLLAKIMPLWER